MYTFDPCRRPRIRARGGFACGRSPPRAPARRPGRHSVAAAGRGGPRGGHRFPRSEWAEPGQASPRDILPRVRSQAGGEPAPAFPVLPPGNIRAGTDGSWATRPATRLECTRAGSGLVGSVRVPPPVSWSSSSPGSRPTPSRDGWAASSGDGAVMRRYRRLPRHEGLPPTTSTPVRRRQERGRQATSSCRCARASWSSWASASSVHAPLDRPAVLLLECPGRPGVVVPDLHLLRGRLRHGRRVGDRGRAAGRGSAVRIRRAAGAGCRRWRCPHLSGWRSRRHRRQLSRSHRRSRRRLRCRHRPCHRRDR